MFFWKKKKKRAGLIVFRKGSDNFVKSYTDPDIPKGVNLSNDRIYIWSKGLIFYHDLANGCFQEE